MRLDVRATYHGDDFGRHPRSREYDRGVSELLDASAMQLARMIRDRQVSVSDVVNCHIERTELVNPPINAVIATCFEQAREQALAADEKLAQTSTDTDALPPLFGLPYTAKEYVSVAGMPLSGGVWSRRNIKAEKDAETIVRLRNAGAILIGLTNVPEGGLWLETYNTVYGRTHNPWNLDRSAGGSSGGEGAIISAGGVAFGLGADVGGSIRIPAAFCGTAGHKPTGRMVPNTGFWPQAEGELSAYLVCGPMTRRCEDLLPILEVLRGPDGVDPVCRDWDLDVSSTTPLEDVTVYPLESNGRVRVNGANRRAIQDATRALTARGAKLGRLEVPAMRQAFEIWSAMMNTAGSTRYSEVLGNGTPVPVFREMIKAALGRSRHTFPALMVAATDEIAALMPGTLQKKVELGHKLQRELEDILGPRGVLLHPPYSRPAPRHYSPLLTPFDFVCTSLFNVMEFPSTVVPMGFDNHGLPLSVQVIGRRGNDPLTIQVAGIIEQAFGGWKRSDPHLLGRRPAAQPRH